MVVLLDSRPAQAQTTERTIWSATLTAKEIDADYSGCAHYLPADKQCSNSAVLSDDDFTFDGTSYNIDVVSIGVTNLDLRFGSSTPFLSEPLTLHVDGTRFDFADDTNRGGRLFAWTTGITWTVGQMVDLKITEKVTTTTTLPEPRPLPPPDPTDPEPQRQCACTQVAASLMPDACRNCAIIASCNKN